MPTLHRHIDTGKSSKGTCAQNTTKLYTSDLIRIYGEFKDEYTHRYAHVTMPQDVTPLDTILKRPYKYTFLILKIIMALISISEASRLTGKSRRTLHRHIDTGKLSKCTDSQNTTKLDTSEIIRVYGEFKDGHTHRYAHVTMSQDVIPPDTEQMRIEIAQLKAQLEAKDSLIEAKQAHIESLNKAILLIEDKRPKEHKRWFQIFRKEKK